MSRDRRYVQQILHAMDQPDLSSVLDFANDNGCCVIVCACVCSVCVCVRVCVCVCVCVWRERERERVS